MLEQYRSPLRTAEAFGIEEVIDPRDKKTRWGEGVRGRGRGWVGRVREMGRAFKV